MISRGVRGVSAGGHVGAVPPAGRPLFYPNSDTYTPDDLTDEETDYIADVLERALREVQ